MEPASSRSPSPTNRPSRSSFQNANNIICALTLSTNNFLNHQLVYNLLPPASPQSQLIQTKESLRISTTNRRNHLKSRSPTISCLRMRTVALLTSSQSRRSISLEETIHPASMRWTTLKTLVKASQRAMDHTMTRNKLLQKAAQARRKILLRERKTAVKGGKNPKD